MVVLSWKLGAKLVSTKKPKNKLIRLRGSEGEPCVIEGISQIIGNWTRGELETEGPLGENSLKTLVVRDTKTSNG